jgi:hypothetical protein
MREKEKVEESRTQRGEEGEREGGIKIVYVQQDRRRAQHVSRREFFA